MLLFGITLVGCGEVPPQADHREFAEVRIESHPKGWGYAHKTVKPDASIVGGHLSGGAEAPRVFESKSVMTSDHMSALRTLVDSVAGVTVNTQPLTPDQEEGGYTSVVIVFSDSSSVTAVAVWGEKYESEAIQGIWDIVSKYEVGAW